MAYHRSSYWHLLVCVGLVEITHHLITVHTRVHLVHLLHLIHLITIAWVSHHVGLVTCIVTCHKLVVSHLRLLLLLLLILLLGLLSLAESTGWFGSLSVGVEILEHFHLIGTWWGNKRLAGLSKGESLILIVRIWIEYIHEILLNNSSCCCLRISWLLYSRCQIVEVKELRCILIGIFCRRNFLSWLCLSWLAFLFFEVINWHWTYVLDEINICISVILTLFFTIVKVFSWVRIILLVELFIVFLSKELILSLGSCSLELVSVHTISELSWGLFYTWWITFLLIDYNS